MEIQAFTFKKRVYPDGKLRSVGQFGHITINAAISAFLNTTNEV